MQWPIEKKLTAAAIVSTSLAIAGGVLLAVIQQKTPEQSTTPVDTAQSVPVAPSQDPILSENFSCANLTEAYLSAHAYDQQYTADPSGKMKFRTISYYIDALVARDHKEFTNPTLHDAMLADLGDYCVTNPQVMLPEAINFVVSQPSHYLP
jgi:hypothetical protein